MTRFTSVLLLLLLFSLPCFAQFKPVAESAPFEEPKTGYAKLIQLKNGNTMYLYMPAKEAIEVKVYDAAHKQKAVKAIAPGFDQSKYAVVKGVFELGGNVVVTICNYEEHRPELYRIVIDGNNGEKLSVDKLGELDKMTYGKGMGVLFGHVALPDFFVRKDPNSDNYAVVMLNSFESDRNKRILITWYGPDNKEINRAYYTSPSDKYKYMDYLDMAVIGSAQVSVLAYAHNTPSHGGRESELVIANLKAGAKSVDIQELPFAHDLNIRYALTRYNPVNKQILMVAAIQTGRSENVFGSALVFIDPFEGKVIDSKTIFPAKANAASISMFGRKGDFNGIPQNLFVNADGSFAVVFEEMAVENPHSFYGMSTSTADSYTKTILGNLAVSQYDAKGDETNSYFIPKSQEMEGQLLHPFYHSLRDGAAAEMHGQNTYKSFAYIYGKDRSYIVFNDADKNEAEEKRGKIATIIYVNQSDGYYFPLIGTDIVPPRGLVFGQPNDKHEHKIGMFGVSDYDRDRNVYAMLQLDREGRSKEVNVVWLQP
ncbi:MAG TPA: hypothetical protein VL547_07170 [Dinghuibacter sp.]|uniref:hypothetical protein n=1 Tax=Dinghuibacter sp. TaxID=2024697 RepID=UPI002B52F198|nr:hypothetical protein [Dinghuibacter sp.]HTJ11787.1 hypothetical protein [Dinghuibacter sp.]